MLADPTAAGQAALDSLAGKVKGKELHRFVAAIREWNANARYCDVSQRCLVGRCWLTPRGPQLDPSLTPA
jgi:hypothetical protein